MDRTARDKVTIGLDFRPLTIDLGDGIDWYFEPDPSPQKFNQLTQAIAAFETLRLDEDSPDPVTEISQASNKLAGLVEATTDAICQVLVDAEQRKQFKKQGYGIIFQQALAVFYMEQLSGFPTQPPSDSGQTSEPNG